MVQLLVRLAETWIQEEGEIWNIYFKLIISNFGMLPYELHYQQQILHFPSVDCIMPTLSFMCFNSETME